MSEELKKYINENSSNLLDKKDKQISKEQVYFHLSNSLNSYNWNIDRLQNINQNQKEQLKNDIKTFLFMSLKSSLYLPVKINNHSKNALWDFNEANFDTNREKWLDTFEFNKYFRNLEEAFKLIIELWWLEKFQKEMWKLYIESHDNISMNMDLFWDKNEKNPFTKNFRDWYLKNTSNLSPQEIDELVHTQFKDDKMKFLKWLSIALWTELWPEAVEIAINFFYDIGKAIIQIPEYMYFKYRFETAKTELQKKEYKMKMKTRLDDNMALWLIALAYDWTSDVTVNLIWANTSADPKWSRFRELIHSIWKPDTWTPAWLKEVIIWLLPFIKFRSSRWFKRASSSVWELWETKKWITQKNTEVSKKPKVLYNINKNNWEWKTSKLLKKEWIVSTWTVVDWTTKRVNNWEIAEANPKTTALNEKLNNPSQNIVKERKLSNGETIKFSSNEYLESYKEWLEKVWEFMKWIDDWVLISSNAMYIKISEYKLLPDDFDIIIRDKDFSKVHKKLEEALKKWQISDLEIHSIDKTFPSNVKNPATIGKLITEWNAKIVFNLETKNGIPIEVELFADWKWNWLIQLWTIPRTVESFFLNWKEIKVSWILDLKDTYTINLMNEILNNNVTKFWEKAKDGARIYNLTHYLRSTGINKPRDLLAHIDEVVAKYREYWWKDLSKWLEWIFAKVPEVKEILGEIIKDYEKQQRIYDRKKWWLPEFQEFTESMNRSKADLHKIYLEVKENKQIPPERKQEIIDILDKNELKNKDIMKITLNNEDFAYFYEMSIINSEYISTIRKILSSNQ